MYSAWGMILYNIYYAINNIWFKASKNHTIIQEFLTLTVIKHNGKSQVEYTSGLGYLQSFARWQEIKMQAQTSSAQLFQNGTGKYDDAPDPLCSISVISFWQLAPNENLFILQCYHTNLLVIADNCRIITHHEGRIWSKDRDEQGS